MGFSRIIHQERGKQNEQDKSRKAENFRPALVIPVCSLQRTAILRGISYKQQRAHRDHQNRPKG